MAKRNNTGKLPDCVFWPDAKPGTVADRTGTRHGRLTLLQPVYIYRRRNDNGRVWYWLAECDCGNEKIFCNVTQTKSCGCLGREARAKAQRVRAAARAVSPIPKVKKTTGPAFIRRKVCLRNRGEIVCRHYAACQDERVFGGKRRSERFVQLGGKCFELAEKDIKIQIQRDF